MSQTVVSYVPPTSSAKRVRSYVPKKSRNRLARLPSRRISLKAFPDTLEVTLRYAAAYTITPVSGIAKYMWRSNDLFDPDYTGTGHQPLYFDTYMAVYNHFVVKKSKIYIKHADGVAYNSVVSVYRDDDTSTEALAENAVERPGVSYDVYIGSVTQPKTLVCTYDAAKVFGPNPMANTKLIGNASASPSEGNFYVYNYEEPGGLRTTAFVIQVLIEYTAILSELKTIVQS